MEIIKKGRYYPEKLYTTNCEFCDSTLRFKIIDGKLRKNKTGHTILTMTCPECNNKTHFNLSEYIDLPPIT